MTKIPTRFSSSESRLYRLSGAHGQEQVSKAAEGIRDTSRKTRKEGKAKGSSQAQFDVQYHTPIHSKVAVQFNKATKKIGDRTLFKNMNGTIAPGAKLAVLGANGSGKPLCSTCFSQTSVACDYRKVVKLDTSNKHYLF